MHWYLDVLKKYTVFAGRAHRQEFWMFTLVHVGICIVLSIVDAMGTGGLLGGLYGLGVLLPSLAVTVRRLHDTSRSGWWVLIGFVPIVGFIVLLIFLVMESTPGSNQYGDHPTGGGT